MIREVLGTHRKYNERKKNISCFNWRICHLRLGWIIRDGINLGNLHPSFWQPVGQRVVDGWAEPVEMNQWELSSISFFRYRFLWNCFRSRTDRMETLFPKDVVPLSLIKSICSLIWQLIVISKFNCNLQVLKSAWVYMYTKNQNQNQKKKKKKIHKIRSW